MKKEHIMDAMGYIDPALVAAADAPAARGRKGWARYGLIAACLCLALVGTAAAVDIIGVRIDWKVPAFWSEDGYSAYGVKGGIVPIPADDFPQAVRDLAEEGRRKYFSSWDEMEQFLGRDLVDNPVLDALRPGNENPGHISLFATAGEQGLCSIVADDIRVLDDHVLIVRKAQLYTENFGDGNFEGALHWAGYWEGSQVAQTEYTTSNGLRAVIVDAVSDASGEGTARCSNAYFSFNGVLYSIEVSNTIGEEDTLTVLKRLLDGFVIN